jgi:hypothetical protein
MEGIARASVYAGMASLAVTFPKRPASLKRYVVSWAYLYAQPTSGTAIIGSKFFVDTIKNQSEKFGVHLFLSRDE